MNATLFEKEAPCYASTSFPEPRPFQSTAHDALRKGLKAGHKNQLIMAPTGAGKSYLGLRIAHEALLKGRRVIFVCDRTTLINQTSEAADKYGLSVHGIIQANHWRFNPDVPFQIASAQTLKNRGWPDADVIIVDEAHTQLSVWTEHIKTCRAAVVGLSATPFSDGLGKLFSNLINAVTMNELTLSGVLVPMKVFSCTKTNMDGAAIGGGEWTDKAAEERGMEIVGDVVVEWVKYAEDRKTIVFGATIAHCEEICRQFNEAGIMAAMFTSKTDAIERAELLTEYKQPDSALKILVSVEALAKGFDAPTVGCVVDCRPLRKSLSTFMQMIGRGLRSSPETGKTDCILLDHSGNILRFMDDYSDIYYNGLEALDAGDKLDKVIRREEKVKEPKGCPSCGFFPFAKRCISCGHEATSTSMVQVEAGEMREVMLGKKKLADDTYHLWDQLCTYAVGNSAPEKQRGRASHLYKDMTGDWPPADFKFDALANTPITRNVMNKIKSKNIAFSRGSAA
ncbi:DEAD/DEAH box helicase [Glaciimonas immobilis]|uniref:Superfamily II DNA or RNA helicase n=1 Tax=Glaciimonas immobilis TaxID=728004 RepID=A0A840RLV9_9BURK|nr:DEAD/DEAH box helicase family protein [Glaciimonas immobilis]KAF3999183.1 DEAD/DEAH box helicase family protein [Glaciimonas immobilis]MBB5198635.1 superfamily II DNA or RNA helicase [Glaciimonas immobilis]